jgi:ADP-heptose:LPS heptosyltransferase
MPAREAAMPPSRLKILRQRIKRPLQTAFARVLVLPLDRRTRTVRDLDALQPRQIVLSRTDRIGDLLCCTPLLLALHRRWPAARLVLIAGAKNRAVLEGLPFLEQGPVFTRDPRSWAELAWWLGRQSFDLGVSLRAESMAGVWVAAWSRAPIRMATHSTYAHPAANLILGIDDFHQTTRYCRAAAALGFPPDEIRPVFMIPADAERRAAEVVPSLRPRDGKPLVGFQMPHRGSRRHAVRAWPLESVVELVRQLDTDGCRVVLCGRGGERAEAEFVKARVAGAVVAPAVPLAVFAALQRHFDLFIAQFTGTLHLADAVGTSAVGFGLESQVAGWGLIGPRHRCIGAPRVSEIPVAALLEAARALLAGRGS